MILIDFSGILMASTFVALKEQDVFSPGLFRHLVLNTILNIKNKFGSKYGEIIVCLDSHNGYWRKEEFPYYKYKRKEQKKSSRAKKDIDWKLVDQTYKEICNEFIEELPYKSIRINMLEADDIIATLAIRFHTEQPIIIISRDGDFKQLQRFKGIKQWDPQSCKMVVESHPTEYLKQHIITGDNGDGIPNILSENNVFFMGTRQSAIRKKDLLSWINKDVREFADTTVILERYRENERLIDLTKIPDKYKEQVLDTYDSPNQGHNRNLYTYLVKHKCINLIDHIQSLKT